MIPWEYLRKKAFMEMNHFRIMKDALMYQKYRRIYNYIVEKKIRS